MKDNRLCFEDIECPYCGDTPGWLFAAHDTGDKIIKCEECGKPFVATISVAPKVDAIYKLEKIE